MRLVTVLLLFAAGVSAQTVQRADSSSLPLTTTRTVTFTTDEGTWMSVDVSPDGKTIVFDLLGDIYTLPLSGGKATPITSGSPFDAQPRFSPDGKSIVFVSDRSGSENLWLMDPTGGHLRALTRTEGPIYVSPSWSPDGHSVVAWKHVALYGPAASENNLYLFDVRGGSGVSLGLTDRAAGPVFTADGLKLYFSTKARFNSTASSYSVWQLAEYDLRDRKLYQSSEVFGGAVRPTVSSDNRWLVYVAQFDGERRFRLRDIRSGKEKWLAPNLHPAMERHFNETDPLQRDVAPGFAFLPDGSGIVASANGKIWKIAVPSGQSTAIPFTVDVVQQLGPLAKFDYPVGDSLFKIRHIQSPQISPDGTRVVFTALDRLWLLDLTTCSSSQQSAAGACAPKRLTTMEVGEHHPTWSRDGKYIAYVTWTEEQGGGIYRLLADGSGPPERLTSDSGFYQHPVYSPDGDRIVAQRANAEPRIRAASIMAGEGITLFDAALVWIRADCGVAQAASPSSPRCGSYSEITRLGPQPLMAWDRLPGEAGPHFGPAPDRVYFADRDEGLISVRLDGTDRKLVLNVPSAARQSTMDIRISPTGDHALITGGTNVYLVTLPQAPGILTLNALDASAPVPARRITLAGGSFINWNPDGRSFSYSLGPALFRYDIATGDSLARQTPAKSYEGVRVDVNITVPSDRARGTVALKGARIITMKGNEVIKNGTIVVTNNRIAAVGPSGSVQIPSGARVVDVTGKTIIPGYVDIHSHMFPAWGVHRSEVWEYLAQLAYGVTTTRDPQTMSPDQLAYRDLVESGALIGPRLFMTGPGIFDVDEINTLDDARNVLRRYAEFYQTNTVKHYQQGSRKRRQLFIMAARELGLTSTAEGGSNALVNLTLAMDGYPGQEHMYPVFPLYNDVVQLLAKSGITVTPTLIINYGALWAEDYWFMRENVHDDAKLQRFIPHAELDRIGRIRSYWAREDQFDFKEHARSVARIVAAGGRIGLGGHGEVQGLSVHWELWTLASGGMPNHDVLRVGTLFPADAIGVAKDLGSLEVGKLADLQVLDKNPLDDIRNTKSLRYVMKNGRLYDASTLDELWPRAKKLPAMWWSHE